MEHHHMLQHLTVVEAERLAGAEAKTQVSGDALLGSIHGFNFSWPCQQQSRHSLAGNGAVRQHALCFRMLRVDQHCATSQRLRKARLRSAFPLPRCGNCLRHAGVEP